MILFYYSPLFPLVNVLPVCLIRARFCSRFKPLNSYGWCKVVWHNLVVIISFILHIITSFFFPHMAHLLLKLQEENLVAHAVSFGSDSTDPLSETDIITLCPE